MSVFMAWWLMAATATTTPDASSTSPLIGTMIQPASRLSVFSNANYHVWGASMVRTEDGICHLIYTRWQGDFESWRTNAELAYAVADSPMGVYRFQHVALTRGDQATWDGVSVYNPQVICAAGKYYLYYAGNNGAIRANVDVAGRLRTQRIGVAVANHPAGPWVRSAIPLIDVSKDGIDSGFTCNPAVSPMPDGRFFMAYKCGQGADLLAKIYHTVATADDPAGPFRKRGVRIWDVAASAFPAEDPFVWHQAGRFHAILKDKHGAFSPAGEALIQFESHDGYDWRPAESLLVSRRQIRWEDGTFETVEHLERPQIWMEDGAPRVLFVAVKPRSGHAYNLAMRLATPGLPILLPSHPDTAARTP